MVHERPNVRIGEDLGTFRGTSVKTFHDQTAGVAAIHQNGNKQLLPNRIGRHDPEIAADIGEHHPDRTLAKPSGDFARAR